MILSRSHPHALRLAPIISSAIGDLVRQPSCVFDETFQEEGFIALRIKISLLATAMTVLALCIIGVLYPGFLQTSFGGAVLERLKGPSLASSELRARYLLRAGS